MKYIPTSLFFKNPKVLSSKALKGVAIFFGVGALILAVSLSYQYMNKASKATTPEVTYNLRVGSCSTSDNNNKCDLEVQKDGNIDVVFELSSNITEKMSGADLFFRYNEPTANILEYVNHSVTPGSFDTTVIEEVHDYLGSSKLLHLVVVNEGNDDALINTGLITLHFKAINTGTSYVNMLTSPSSIVGPVDPLEYEIKPQNLPGTTDDKMANIYHANINVVTTSTPSGTPTATPTNSPSTTLTPSISPSVTPSPTVTPMQTLSETPIPTTPTGNITTKIDYRIKLQGISKLPKQSSPIDVEVTLSKNKKKVDTRTISFAPQNDGSWLASANYSNIPSGSNYSVSIKGPKHLRKSICIDNPQEAIPGTYNCKKGEITLQDGDRTLDFLGIYLLAGDLPLQNGLIDAVDIIYIRSNLGSKNPEAVSRGDLNYDGIVDSQDYTMILNSLSFKYDEI